MNILRKCQNQNQVKEIENGQQPVPRKIATPQNVRVAILRGAGSGLLAIFYFLYLILILAPKTYKMTYFLGRLRSDNAVRVV